MSSMRRAIVLACVALGTMLAPGSVDAKSPPETISSDQLPYTITLPWQDRAALWDAEGSPNLLVEAPASLGPGYDVLSWYWGTLQPGTDDVATYYPERGILRLTTYYREAWYQLDSERQAILNRYVTLGQAGLLPPQPMILDLLGVSYQHGGERISIEVGGAPLEPGGAEERLFWREAAVTTGGSEDMLERGWKFSARDNFYVTFFLPERREISLLYIRDAGYLVDMSVIYAAGNIVPVQASKASPRLRALLELVGPAPTASVSAADERSVGSRGTLSVWAVIFMALGGAIALGSSAALFSRTLLRPASARGN